ncbi:MAG: DUF1566 domain-containing protein [bacterium]|nr:DUF1566 domain-containing protein [bacterium]
MKRFLILCWVLLALVGCKKQMEAPATDFEDYAGSNPSSQAALRSFGLRKAHNAALSADALAVISGTTLGLSLPDNLDQSALVPSFEFTGAKVTVDSVEPISGETAQDFSNGPTYRVEAFDGSHQDFTAVVTTYDPNDPLLASGENGISLASGADSTQTKTVSVALAANDEDGLVGYYLSESATAPALDAEGWVTFAPTENYLGTTTFTLSNTDGTKTVYAWFKDSSGEVLGGVSDQISLSRTYSISLADGAASTSTKSITASLSAATSGISGYYLSETNSTPTADASGWVAVSGSGTSWSGTASFTLSDNDGTKTVYAWFKDSSGEVQGGVSDGITLSLPKALTAFSFKKSDNSPLLADVDATISGTAISVTLWEQRANQTKMLVPRFASTGTSVWVGSTQQSSGTSSQDFTHPVTYKVQDTDGGTQAYTVSVTVHSPVPDTGQTSCYDNSTAITCPSAGQNFYGQDAQYQPSLNQQSYTDNGDGTVTDNLSGLVWQRCSAGLSGANCATGTAATYTWADAGTYCTDNTAGLPGTGWRLPTKTELSWIVRSQGSAPFIDTTAFPATVSSDYWTSTSYALLTNSAWYVLFSSGDVPANNKASNFYVRCVR